jgi:hypothetical protein
LILAFIRKEASNDFTFLMNESCTHALLNHGFSQAKGEGIGIDLEGETEWFNFLLLKSIPQGNFFMVMLFTLVMVFLELIWLWLWITTNLHLTNTYPTHKTSMLFVCGTPNLLPIKVPSQRTVNV